LLNCKNFVWILKRDELYLKEIEIWENLTKWGLAQEQVRNKDVTKWNQDVINRILRYISTLFLHLMPAKILIILARGAYFVGAY
jgi:hypothetical protein